MLCTKLFERIVVDEAQRLKNIKTHTHLNVLDIKIFIINFFIAISMINKLANLESLLAFA